MTLYRMGKTSSGSTLYHSLAMPDAAPEIQPVVVGVGLGLGVGVGLGLGLGLG